MLGKFGVFHRAESDHARDVFFLFLRHFRVLLVDHGARPRPRLVEQGAQRDIVARARLHQFVVFSEDAAERDVLELGAVAHAARGREDLLKVELLRRAGHIPDGIGLPTLFAILDGGQIRCRVEKSTVAFADQTGFVGQRRDVAEKHTNRTLADFRHSIGQKCLHQGGQCGIVETLAETFVETDAQPTVDFLELGPREIDELLPDGAVLRVTLLKFDQFLARGPVHRGIGLLDRVDFAVEPRHFRHGITLQRGTIEEVLPAVKNLAELRAPIAEMIVGHDLVSEKSGDAGERVAENGAADVADVHRLGDVRRTEIDDDFQPLFGLGRAAARIGRENPQLPRDPTGLEAEVEEARSRNLRLGAYVAAFELFRDLRGKLARISFRLLGQNHGGIGLVIAEARVCRRHDVTAFGRKSACGERRAQPLRQRGLRRGAHSARSAAAGENLQDGLGIGRGGQFVAHFAVVEELGDGGERAQVDLELIARDNEEDDEMDQFVVEGVEFDARRGPAESGHDFADVLARGVRDGDAEPYARAHRFLALLQGGEDAVAVVRGNAVARHQQVHDLGDRRPPLGRLHLGNNLPDGEQARQGHVPKDPPP